MTASDVRYCFECRAEITACMGFCMAGDIVEAYDGKRLWRDVRERCWRCVEIQSLLAHVKDLTLEGLGIIGRAEQAEDEIERLRAENAQLKAAVGNAIERAEQAEDVGAENQPLRGRSRRAVDAGAVDIPKDSGGKDETA